MVVRLQARHNVPSSSSFGEKLHENTTIGQTLIVSPPPSGSVSSPSNNNNYTSSVVPGNASGSGIIPLVVDPSSSSLTTSNQTIDEMPTVFSSPEPKQRLNRTGWIIGISVSLFSIAILIGCCVRYQKLKQRSLRAKNNGLLSGGDGTNEGEEEKGSKPKQNDNNNRRRSLGGSRFFKRATAEMTTTSESATTTTGGIEFLDEKKGSNTTKPRLLGSFCIKSFTPKPAIDMSIFEAGAGKKDPPVDTFQMEVSYRARRSKQNQPVPPIPPPVRTRDPGSSEHTSTFRPGLLSYPQDLGGIGLPPTEFNSEQLRVAYPLQTYGHLDTQPFHVAKSTTTITAPDDSF